MRRGTDVLIIGAGAIGAAIAYYCADQGLTVRVLDRGFPGSGTSSRCEGNILISDKERGPELDLANYSLGLWHGELREFGERWELERKGGIIVASHESSMQSLRRVLAAQREHGITVEEIDASAVTELEPYISPHAVGAALYPDDSQVMPIKLVFEMLSMARARGAEVVPKCEVTGLLRNGDRVIGAQTEHGNFTASVVVNACGPWSGQVAALAGIDLPVAPRRGYVMVTEPLPPRVFHKVYAAEYIDNVGSADTALQCSPVVESTPAGSILMGSSREQVGFSAETNVDALRQIANNAIELFPFLEDVRVLRHYYGFRPYSPDHLPMIGEDPRAPGLWHATGHEGAGIGLSVGTGKLLSQAILGEPTDISLDAFDPARFSHATINH